MKYTYLITQINSKKATYLLEDGKLTKACPLSAESLIGNIYTAKVVNVVPSINAAFLDVGERDYFYYSIKDNEGKHIFLKHGNTEKVCMGDELLVQISKDPIKTKKGEATSDINLKGSYIVVNRSGDIGISKKIHNSDARDILKREVSTILEEYKELNPGVVIRTSAEKLIEAEGGLETFKKETITLLCKLKEIIDSSIYKMPRKLVFSAQKCYLEDIDEMISKDSFEKLDIVTDIDEIYDELREVYGEKYSFEDKKRIGTFDENRISFKLMKDELTSLELVYSLQSKIEKLMGRTVLLKSGGSIVVEPTEAMVVIDVNTGKAIKGRNSENKFLSINKEAAEMIARVLRLRNLSGIIIIDFINMNESSHMHEVIEHLKKEVLKDEVRVTYVDTTTLGLVELTRKKTTRPLRISDFI